MTTTKTLTQSDADFLEKQFSKVFATKKDLVTFATKKDLYSYVTKDYLDLKLGQQKDDIIDEFKKFRSQFYKKIDPILKEVITSREDRTVRAEQHRRNKDRIEDLEKIHPQGHHLAII